jgi:NTE family protein
LFCFMPKKLFIICLVLYSFTLQAQTVAVVFSGGGAKGLAHIGVLKALEENNIPIDYIIGTSMGGVVGGFYAAGYSPDEIEHIALSEEFLNWINGEPEEGMNYHFYKKEENASMLSIKLALDSSLNAQFNTSLANDLSLNFALAEKLAQPSANAGYNFDNFFVPVRIVASEIFTQKTVVLKSGTLNNALRATLSVPFFYKPIKINGRYLFDGGIYNNFPIDIAKEQFNPDFIIGANVSSKVFSHYPYEQDNQLISNSLLYMLLDKSDSLKLDENSIYIEPNLKDFTPFDFNKARELIDSGYNATMRQMPDLLEKIKERSSCDELTEKRNQFNNKNDPFIFSKVEVYDFNEKQKKFIKKLFKTDKKEYLTLREVKKFYYRLMSESFFQTIYPNITYDSTDNAFVLELNGRPNNDLTIQIGGSLSTRNMSAIFLGGEFYYFNSFLLNTAFNVYGGNFYKSAQLRSRFYFTGLGHWYLEPDFTYNNWEFMDIEDIIVDEKLPTILNRSDRHYGVHAGFPLGQHYKLELTGSYIYNKDYFSNNPTLNLQDTLDFLNLHGLKTGFNISLNTLNDKMFPDEGRLFKFSAYRYDLTEDYEPGSTSELRNPVSNSHSWYKGEIHLERYFKYGSNSTGYLVEGVWSNQPSFASEMGTTINLPAFFPLIDSRTLLLQNFRSPSYIAAGFRNIYSLHNNFAIRLEGYAFKELASILNKAEVNEFNREKEPVHFAASGTMVYDTPVGPLSLSLNYYDDRETNFGILLNFGYLLFNRTSLD